MSPSKPAYPRGVAKLLLGAFFALAVLGSCIGKTADAPDSAQIGTDLEPGIDYESLLTALERNPGRVLLLDVRTAEEFAQGHIPGSVLVPYDVLGSTFKEYDKHRPIVVYCRSGRRSALALATLQGLGYVNISDFGDIGNWKGKLEP